MRETLRRFITLVSGVVPTAERREFRAEWEGELATDPSLRRALGALPDAWSLFRRQWTLDGLTQDLRYSLRVLARRPSYTLLVLLTLAIGIGAAVAVFSAIDGILLRPLPYPDPQRLVKVWENDRLNRKPQYPVAPANWNDWRTQTHSFEHLAAYGGVGGATLSTADEPFHAAIQAVSTDFFDVLGVRPLLGRTFAPGESVPPRHRVLVLSYETWQRRFGADPGVVERHVTFADADYRIIGVMPRGFAFPGRELDGWRAAAETPQLLATRAQHFMSVVGRLKPGVSVEDARADLEAVAVRAQKAFPATNDQRGTTLLPLRDAIVGEARTPILLLGAAVTILLLIGLVNVANLMLVEATARSREIGVRTALGADRMRLVRQLLVEGTMLSVVGGALGVGLAAVAVRLVGRAAVDYVPRLDHVAVDGRVLAFALAISLTSGLLFASAPALASSRAPIRALREGGRGAIGAGARLRNALVTIEFAAAVVLVIAAGLVARSFWNVLRVQPGFTADHVLTASIALPQRYQANAPITQFYTDLLARLQAVPGIRAAGVVNNLPVSGDGWTSWLTIENRPRPAGEPPEVGYRTASDGYLAALQIPVLAGRGVAETDSADALKVAVVNRALADRFFAGEEAIGRRIRLGPNPKAPWRTIVGVVGNVRHAGPETEPAPEVFLPAAQDVNDDMSLAVRGDGDAARLVAIVRDAVRAVDPAVTVWQTRTLDAMIDEAVAPRRLAMLLVEGFASVALALALVGIYGVLSYTVSQRMPEIGVRMALGADPSEIRRMTMAGGMRVALPGIVMGGAISFAATRVIRAMLFGVSPTDPAAYAVLVGSVIAVALLACYLPARRASRIDPLQAIRVE